MAQFDETKVINALHPEKAEVGKKYWYSDNLISLKKFVENNNTEYIGKLKNIDNCEVCIFEMDDEYVWEFLYPYEEPPKQRMTNRQLSEWMAQGKGEVSLRESFPAAIPHGVYTYHSYNEGQDNKEVEKEWFIRYWGSEEWIEPTLEVYLKDCKGETNDTETTLS